MNVGELFINLGIKGTDKTVGALHSVHKGLSDTTHLSFEAKAALVAAMYTMEQLFSASGKVGTGLTTFAKATGISTQMLQQYQYAGRQVGVTNEQTANTFKKLQDAMAGAAIGKAPPEGMSQLAAAVGGIKENYKELSEHPEKLFQYLQKGAQKIHNIPFRNQVLKSFGIDEGMIAAMSRNAFNPKAFSQAPIYNDKEVSQLDRANIAWSNLGTSIEMAFGHFNAKHGTTFVNEISQIINQLLKLTEALTVLADKFKIFEGISNVLSGIANTFKLVSEVSDKVQGKQLKKGDLLYSEPGSELIPGLKGSPIWNFFKSFSHPENVSHLKAPSFSIPLPAFPGEKSGKVEKNQNVTIHQNLNFQHEGRDHNKISHSVKKSVENAFRQFSAQGQGA